MTTVTNVTRAGGVRRRSSAVSLRSGSGLPHTGDDNRGDITDLSPPLTPGHNRADLTPVSPVSSEHSPPATTVTSQTPGLRRVTS